jgi:hypothetical protein
VKQKHTPGPWQLEADWMRNSHALFTADGGWVCEIVTPVSTETYGREHSLANARLIASAPDLLEALQALDSTMERVDRSHLTFTDRKLIDGMYAQILRAIAKATGGAR